MKKGDVNWQMVMMILAMIILVVLLFIFKDVIFTSKDNLNNMNSCEGRGGQVRDGQDAKCLPGEIEIFPAHYIDENCNEDVKCKCCISQKEYLNNE